MASNLEHKKAATHLPMHGLWAGSKHEAHIPA